MRYRHITVAGNPTAMGQAIGEAARDEIRGFVGIALERVDKTLAVSRATAMRVASQCVPLAESYAPDMMAELRGTAGAAGVSIDDLMLLQVHNQLQPDAGNGCTAVSASRSVTAGGSSLIGQNWDNDPALDPFTIVLTRRGEGRQDACGTGGEGRQDACGTGEGTPATMSVTQAGLIGYIGISDAGMGLCLNTLPAPGREIGVPHYFIVRAISEAASLDDAVREVSRARRAIPANVLLATPQGPADLEITIDDLHVLRDDGSGIVTHTNHCLHPDLAAVNDRFPELIQSRPRKDRVDRLLQAGSDPLGAERLKTILADHDNHPRSICRHANDDAGTGFWKTVFSVIMEPDAGLMHLARGNPCDAPYEVYKLA